MVQIFIHEWGRNRSIKENGGGTGATDFDYVQIDHKIRLVLLGYL